MKPMLKFVSQLQASKSKPADVFLVGVVSST